MVMSQSQTGALTPSIAERPVRLGGQECDQIDQLLIIVFSASSVALGGLLHVWLVLVRTIVRQREMDSPAARSTTAASPILVLELWALPTRATRRAGHGQLWRDEARPTTSQAHCVRTVCRCVGSLACESCCTLACRCPFESFVCWLLRRRHVTLTAPFIRPRCFILLRFCPTAVVPYLQL